MASTHTRYGRFVNHYRALKRAGRLDQVPLILSEGDSWFSMPLYYNIVDWLEISSSADAVFLRLESSGALATDMFSAASLRKLSRRLKDHDFDLLLISAGGNDFVGDFLRDRFRGTPRMTVDQALDQVGERRFDDVRRAYLAMIDTALQQRPSIRILTHSYDYPRLMGKPATLTIENIGLAALLKREIGDWIARHLVTALPEIEQQREFARRLIDRFCEIVLQPLSDEFGDSFGYVDLRGTLTRDEDWNDEMHPTADACRRLAAHFLPEIVARLPAEKKAHF